MGFLIEGIIIGALICTGMISLKLSLLEKLEQEEKKREKNE